MLRRHAAVLLSMLLAGPVAARSQPPPAPGLQAVADDYLKERGQAEHVTGIALHVDTGRGAPVDVFAGTYGRSAARIDSATLFQIGSNTKHFTAALILKLEALGKLRLDQTVGDWLPQYPDWAHWTIRSLLNMTTDIPNYTETEAIGRIEAADPDHQFSKRDLVAAVYGKGLPGPDAPWFYSNTNSILAGLIVEAATHMSYAEALRRYVLNPLQLRDTFYADGPYPPAVLARLPQGIYANAECLAYQPKPCAASTLAPLVGRDVSRQNLSWAGPAGAIVSNPRDLGAWIRDLFALKLFPRQQLDEMVQLVSMKTGKPIPDVGTDDPMGFALDLGKAYRTELGSRLWFYQGTTLGFRAVFAYWPQQDLVITAATNSQPPEGEDKFIPLVLGGAFRAVTEAAK